MSSSVERSEKTWPIKFAVSDNKTQLPDDCIVKNVEMVEPGIDLYGYTDNSEDLKFHVPNTIDFDIRSANRIKYAKSITQQEPSTQTTHLSDQKGDENRMKHFWAGGIAAFTASIVTCPLDVIKTRQQSSGHLPQGLRKPKPYMSQIGSTGGIQNGKLFARTCTSQINRATSFQSSSLPNFFAQNTRTSTNSSILQHYRYIKKVEGIKSLYKGLCPTLVGVVPSRAIYFFAYSNSKNYLSKNFGISKDASKLHLMSAAIAGVSCTTATSPLWVIKTKLQLHRSVQKSMTVRECCIKIWRAGGVKGFYRGMSASYAGILETVVHFGIYERLKLLHMKDKEMSFNETNMKSWSDYIALMAIAATSKTTATCIAYPHEVVRTRLREETKQRKYRGFFQTLSTVAKQEGFRALYRGLGTQIVRQVPNMAIVMGTYEFLIDSSSRL